MARQMKPRISKSGKYWLCKGANAGFLGGTPRLAYQNWKRFMIEEIVRDVLTSVNE